METIAHGTFNLTDNLPPNGTMLVFYRGLHCPICKHHIKEMDDRIGDFALRGVSVLAISCDPKAKAQQLADEMQIIRLPLAHSLDIRVARDEWGLFVSQARKGTDEPGFFTEPGHFWIRQDGNVAFSVLHSTPFMRPNATQILRAIDKNPSNTVLPRGAYSGPLTGSAPSS